MDDLGKSIPMAEGMVDAEQSGTPKRNNEFCLNCGTKLIDSFCQHCGQKDIPKRQTLGELWSNFISSFWSYEGKFFLTTKYLIIKPGFLPTEYNAGKRESYFHPARMYVFISFVFFLLFFSLPDDETTELTEKDKKEIAENTMKGSNIDSIIDATIDGKANKLAQSISDSVKKKVDKKKKKKWAPTFNIMDVQYKSIPSYDSTQKLLPEAKRDGWFKKKTIYRGIELTDRYRNDSEKFSKDFGDGLKENFSKFLFYLLPIFALIFKLLYVRRNYYYSEHLVFSIYYYNFFYFGASLQMLINLVPWLSWLATLLGFWIYFYLLFAMKRMYGQGWGKTILKFSLFNVMFMFFALFALILMVMIVIMFL